MPHRLAPHVREAIADGWRATSFACTQLGAITRAANNFETSVVDPATGETTVKVCRDSEACKSESHSLRTPYVESVPPMSTAAPFARPLSSRAKRQLAGDAEALVDAQFVSDWVTSRTFRPCEGLTASERLEAIKSRVRAKAARVVE